MGQVIAMKVPRRQHTLESLPENRVLCCRSRDVPVVSHAIDTLRIKIVGKIRALHVRQYKSGGDPRLTPQLGALEQIHRDLISMGCLDAAESWIDKEISVMEHDLDNQVPEAMPSDEMFSWNGGFMNQYKLFMYWWAKDQITLLNLEGP